MNRWAKTYRQEKTGTTVHRKQLHSQHCSLFSTNAKEQTLKVEPPFHYLGNATYYCPHITTVYLVFASNTHGLASTALRLFWCKLKIPLLPFRQCYRRFANILISCFCNLPCFNFSCGAIQIPTKNFCPAKFWDAPTILHMNCQRPRRSGFLVFL